MSHQHAGPHVGAGERLKRERSQLGSSHETPGESPGFLLWQVATLWQQRVREALRELELTHAQFVLLASVAWLAREGRAVTQAQIAEHAKTDAVMTSEVLRTLERRGLVRRLTHPDDARAKRVEPTPAGRALAERAIPKVEAVDEAFFSEAGPELRALTRALSHLGA